MSIDPAKLKSFNTYMKFYKQKNYMSKRDFAHIMNLAQQDLTNVQPHNYSVWQKAHEVDLSALDALASAASIASQEQEELDQSIENIDMSINCIADLIAIVDKYPLSNKKYNIDVKMLHTIQSELRELNSMIGIVSLKSAILDQLLYYLQGFHLQGSADDYKHTVLYGPPGSGKTEIAKIIGKMYSKMGVIKKPISVSGTGSCGTSVGTSATTSPSFKKITRADLVAGYLGQTAIKTKNVITESLGGVVFLDEAYSLGHKEGADSFSKECADTLCESLSHNRENIMFIIAGYEKELDTNFFGLNPGLESRFVWRFKIDNYTYDDLWQIFLHKVKVAGWTCDDVLSQSGKAWFKTKFDNFTGLGRDIDTLLFKTKISHSRANYGKTVDDASKYMLSVADLNAGFALFMKSRSGSAETEKRERKRIAESLYI
jgi:SpoVK/Ycf46/Vps4 family AAA+-type ATPase